MTGKMRAVASSVKTSVAADGAMADFDALARELRASVTTLRLLVEGAHDGIVDVAHGSRDVTDMLTHVRHLSDLIASLGDYEGARAQRDRTTAPR